MFKTIVGGRLPPEITERRKLGFNAPFSAWMRRPANAREIRERWLDPRALAARGILEPAAIERLWSEHQAGTRDHGPKLWGLIILETWLRLYAA